MAKYMEYAEKVFKEYDDLKNENRTLKNILHEIWDILEDSNIDDEDATMKIGDLNIFVEILKEKENMKKDEDESDEDGSDEEDKQIKNVLNTTIKNTEEYNIILKEEEDKMFEDADEDELNRVKAIKFTKHMKQNEDEIKRKKEEMEKGINIGELCSSSEDEKDYKKLNRWKVYDTPSEEESDEESEEDEKDIKKQNKKIDKEKNEKHIREFIKRNNIGKLHHLQETNLKDYCDEYNFYNIKDTKKCWIVQFGFAVDQVGDLHRIHKSLRLKKP